MVSLTELWLPILISVVGCFVLSSLIWMVLPHHKNDWKAVPDEEATRKALRETGIQPGMYNIPNCGGDMKKMQDPEFQKKLEEGPVAMLFVGENGPPNMGKSLGQWALYLVFVAVSVAYVTTHAKAAGAEFMEVFQVAGATAFLAYSSALIPQGAWKLYDWNVVWKEVFDGLLYALITGAALAAFWPGMPA